MRSALLSRHLATAAVLAMAAWGAASSAHAGSDVSVSIGIQIPGGRVHPAPVNVPQQPVYVPQQPVFVPPRTVYVQPAPVYVQPRPVFVPPQAIVYYGYAPQPGWHRGKWHHRHGHGPQGRFDDRGWRDDDRGGHGH